MQVHTSRHGGCCPKKNLSDAQSLSSSTQTCSLLLETGKVDAASAATPPPGLPLTDWLVAAAAPTSAVAVEASPALTPPVLNRHRVSCHIGMQIVFNPTAFSKTKMLDL